MYNVLCKATKPIACGINIVKKVNYSTLTIVLEELKSLFNAAIDSQLQNLNKLFSEHAVESVVLN
jgi:hypothetical protein